MTTTSSLRGQGELLVHLPYQLGFTPADSVVVVGLDARHTIVVTVRLDPPDHSQTDEITGLFGRGRLRELAHAVVVLAESESSPDNTVAEGAGVVRAALARNGIDVDHELSVDYEAQTWRARECGCGQCPDQPVALPQRHEVAAVLDAALRGVAPEFGREAVELQCTATVDESRLVRFVDLCRYFATETAADLDQLAPVVDLARPVPDDPVLLARATAAIGRVAVRDELLHRLRPDAFPPSGAPDLCFDSAAAGTLTGLTPHLRPTVVARLVRWACRVPAGQAVPIWTCVAALEWAGGGGALATIALDKALSADPHYNLAKLIHGCLMVGAMPQPSLGAVPPPAA